MDTVGDWLTQAVLPGAGSIVLLVALGLAREFAGQLRDERTRKVLLALVQAAEQLYGPGKGEAKRRFVREKMKQKGLGDLGREELEAAVYRMKAEAK
jgi:hypothetical protein